MIFFIIHFALIFIIYAACFTFKGVRKNGNNSCLFDIKSHYKCTA